VYKRQPCVVPRAVPIVEAMAALVIADFVLRNRVVKLENIVSSCPAQNLL